MDLPASELQNLRQIANQLLDLVERVAGDPVEVPEHIAKMVEDKVSKRICLSCGEKTPESSKYRRGNDDACYGTQRNRIRRGEVRESQLVATGKLTPEAKTPGRKAKMDAADEAAEDVKVAEQQLKQRRKKQ